MACATMAQSPNGTEGTQAYDLFLLEEVTAVMKDNDLIEIFRLEELEAFYRQWVCAEDIQHLLGVGTAQAKKLLRRFAAVKSVRAAVRISGSETRPRTYVPRKEIERYKLMEQRRGNPKFADTGFQQEMAFRRWHGNENAPSAPLIPLERGYFEKDEVRFIRI